MSNDAAERVGSEREAGGLSEGTIAATLGEHRIWRERDVIGVTSYGCTCGSWVPEYGLETEEIAEAHRAHVARVLRVQHAADLAAAVRAERERIAEAFRGDEYEDNAAAAAGEGEWSWWRWLVLNAPTRPARAAREAERGDGS